ncbi:hypothetical protein [Streptacidiphilus sp. PAMC 29251]
MSADEPSAASPRRGPSRRTGFVAAGVLLLLVVAVVLVVALSGGKKKAPVAAPPSTPSAAPSSTPPPPPSPTPTPVPQTFPYVVLQAGDCVSDPSITSSLKKVTKHDCHSPHDAQITGLVQLPAGLKTAFDVNKQGRTLCKTLNDAAWHQQPAALADRLNEGIYFPDLKPYRAGTHTVTCMLEIGFRASKLTAPLH